MSREDRELVFFFGDRVQEVNDPGVSELQKPTLWILKRFGRGIDRSSLVRRFRGSL